MDFKYQIKSFLSRVGVGQLYHDFWWVYICNDELLTDWNINSNIVFVHIPKNAGTSIYHSLGMTLPRDSHIPASAYVDSHPSWDSVDSFCISRNPWDRLVSAFHYLRFDTDFSQDKWFSDKYLSRFDDFDAFISELKCNKTFRYFILTWRHFMPQSYFVCDRNNELLVKDVLRLEFLEEELSSYCHSKGVDFVLKKANQSNRSSYIKYYKKLEDVDIVREMYSVDIELFGYQFGVF
nr:sulfotransferase family 2 domain-containing protein [uncultured Amphritea sp.]